MDRPSVLLALHRPGVPAGLAAALEEVGLSVRVTRNMAETYLAARDGAFDLVLLDPLERDLTAAEARTLLGLARRPGGPGLVLFTEEPGEIGPGVEELADFLAPDAAPEAAAARLRFALERHRTDQRRRARMATLARATITDFKTGLFNDRYFHERCREEASRSRRQGTPIAVMMLDLDDFKAINDRHGHDFGDYVLEYVAKNLRSCVRDFDVAARVGGDEFAVLLVGASLEQSISIAERVRSTIAALVFERDGRTARCTISIGVGSFDPERDGDLERLLEHVDQALLRAKREGRNRLAVHRPEREAQEAPRDGKGRFRKKR